MSRSIRARRISSSTKKALLPKKGHGKMLEKNMGIAGFIKSEWGYIRVIQGLNRGYIGFIKDFYIRNKILLLGLQQQTHTGRAGPKGTCLATTPPPLMAVCRAGHWSNCCHCMERSPGKNPCPPSDIHLATMSQANSKWPCVPRPEKQPSVPASTVTYSADCGTWRPMATQIHLKHFARQTERLHSRPKGVSHLC